jgi:hypothetical protein
MARKNCKISLAFAPAAAASLRHENKKQMVASARLVSAFRGSYPRISAVHDSLRRPEHVSGYGERPNANSATETDAEEGRLLRIVIGVCNSEADYVVYRRHYDNCRTDPNHRTGTENYSLG